jgi:hypothetical protein
MMISSRPPPAMPRQPAHGEAPRKPFFAAVAALTGKQRTLILLWVLVVIVPATYFYSGLVKQQHENVRIANETAAALLSTSSAVSNHTQPEKTPPPGHENDVPRVVRIGMYVNRIPEFSIIDSLWKADFYVWFSWEGDDKEFDPGENFKMATGEVLNRELLKRTDKGNSHYELYRATAEISKKFNISRFPLDEHLLTISIEDKKHQSYEMKFETDPAASDVSSRSSVQGYVISGMKVSVKPHSYKTSMGDPDLPTTYRATYSQFIAGISIKRGSWGLFAKMFLALYIASLLALGGLVLSAPSERLALAGTALFVAIMNAEANASSVPATGTATLGDVIDGIGYAVMAVIVAQSIIYHRFIYKDGENSDFARVFDMVSIVMLSVGYLIMNLGVLYAAQG